MINRGSLAIFFSQLGYKICENRSTIFLCLYLQGLTYIQPKIKTWLKFVE